MKSVPVDILKLFAFWTHYKKNTQYSIRHIFLRKLKIRTIITIINCQCIYFTFLISQTYFTKFSTGRNNIFGACVGELSSMMDGSIVPNLVMLDNNVMRVIQTSSCFLTHSSNNGLISR